MSSPSPLPIYDYLESISSNNNLSEKKKEEFINSIKNMNLKDLEIIYAIIKIHFINYSSTSTYILPYGGKQQKGGIKFDLDLLPGKLQNMLYNFFKLQTKTENKD